MDISHIPVSFLSVRFLIKTYCAEGILLSSLFHFSPFLLSSLHNQCHGKRGEICRKMRNVWTKDGYFSRKSKMCGKLSLNFVGLHGRWLPTFITIYLLHLTFE